jgi:hypothetical protein
MKEAEEINTWEEFEETIKTIDFSVQDLRNNEDNAYVSTPLFRGQSDGGWHLETTLDRLSKNVAVDKYFGIIRSIKAAVESCTSRRWELPEVKTVVEKNRYCAILPLEYEFMAYLRHNGFPSPLLDWTRSPYIAAFFAFSEDRKTDPAIFVYTEDMGEGKVSDSINGRIVSMGPNVRTHKRHFLQQSEYTYCVKKGLGNNVCYTSHEDVFSKSIPDLGQDNLEKYILSYDQRANFLSKLNLMNINAYSLFETEEGLMNKLAIEELLIKNI